MTTVDDEHKNRGERRFHLFLCVCKTLKKSDLLFWCVFCVCFVSFCVASRRARAHNNATRDAILFLFIEWIGLDAKREQKERDVTTRRTWCIVHGDGS